jgi:hypothetical protein
VVSISSILSGSNQLNDRKGRCRVFASFWKDWTFQQEGAPSHTSINDNSNKFEISTQTWSNQKFLDFIRKNEWPAASPNLNPLD